MTVFASPPANRRLTAVSLASLAAKSLRPSSILRRLFQQPSETLDRLSASSGKSLNTLLAWSQSTLLGGEVGLHSLDCARLVWGDERTAALAISAVTLMLYEQDVQIVQYQRSKLALHQLSVAWAAESIARRADIDASRAFLVGAVHDIGYLALEKLARQRFTQVLESIDRATPTAVVEREAFDCDHAMVGAELLREWGAPDDICEAVQWHHQPLGASENSKRVAAAVCLANYLVSRLGICSLGVQNVHPPADEIFAQLNFGYREVSDVVDYLVETLPYIEPLLE